MMKYILKYTISIIKNKIQLNKGNIQQYISISTNFREIYWSGNMLQYSKQFFLQFYCFLFCSSSVFHHQPDHFMEKIFVFLFQKLYYSASNDSKSLKAGGLFWVENKISKVEMFSNFHKTSNLRSWQSVTWRTK